jgi:glycosyltransferase involved in cell wall biosynthesis
MQDISGDYLHIEDSKPNIEVLLATYNGAAYLGAFLESLAQQVGVSIDLRVSDDGSTDSTLIILESYRESFNSLVVTAGPEKGPSENFFSLIAKAKSKYVALADQDDIWEPTHLINSIDRLAASGDVPALSFTRVSEFREKPFSQSRLWPSKVNVDTPMFLFAENFARGCTIVFNKQALDAINRHKPSFAIMHDWWIALLISLIGKIKYTQIPEVNYRIHPNNFVGGKPTFRRRLIRFYDSRKHEWSPATQLREIYANYGGEIDPDKLKFIEQAISGLTSDSIVKRLRTTLTSHELRSSKFEDFWLRIVLMVGPNLNQSFLWFLYRRIRSLLAKVIYFIVREAPMKVTDFRDIKILKKHMKENIIKESFSLPGSNKIALVALFPRGPLLKSVERLISNLLDREYEVVVVINQSNLRDWIPKLSNYPISILKRQNVGRDFGAYQAGIGFLKNKGLFTNIETLLMCNDSVFYGENFGDFLAKYEKESASWTAAFINFEKHTHAQSFFQSFTGEVVRNQVFQNFWLNYYPSNSRVHAIDKGEVMLSQTLLRLGYFPKSIVNAKNLADYYQSEQVSFEDFYSILSEGYYNILNYPPQIQNDYFWHALQRAFMEQNCSHLAGLLAFKALGAPLKLDLFATGRVTLESIQTAISQDGIQEEEVAELIQEFSLIRARLI